MNFLEERIVKDGIVKEGNVLKVDSFLNHQMDIELFDQMGADLRTDQLTRFLLLRPLESESPVL